MAVSKIVFSGTNCEALDVDAARVECGVNISMSIPEAFNTSFTHLLRVSRDTGRCGFLIVTKSRVSVPRSGSVTAKYCVSVRMTQSRLSGA